MNDFSFMGFWLGKIIGAMLGYLTGGPVGAVFGILIGNFFDRGLAKNISNPFYIFHHETRKATQRTFFQSTFLIMGHIAKSDGRVSEREIDLARQLMKEMRLSSAQKDEAKALFSQGKQASFNLGHTLTQLKTHCANKPELLKLFVDIQYRAACIDGLNQQKIEALNRILSFLDFAPLSQQYRFYQDFFQQHQQRNQQKQQRSYQRHQGQQRSQNRQYDPLERAYAILEVQPTASKQAVKKAYRRLMSQNHPDKLIAKGLPEEMIKIATDKTQTISKAYDEICEAKGWC